MKKSTYLLFLAILFYSFQVNAQLKFGVQLGVNSTSVKTFISKEYKDLDFPTKSKFGLNVGLSVSYMLNDQMSIESGLLFTQKGYQIDWDAFLKENNMNGTVDGYWKYNYNYLEIPLHFNYHINGLQIFAGPYLAYGIGGTSVVDITYDTDGENGEIKEQTSLSAVSGAVKSKEFIGGNENIAFNKSYNAFDIGLDLGAGYQYEQFLLKLQYSFGFKNLTPEISDSRDFDPNDFKFTNNGILFSVIYYFSK